jgi:hypothetical protein
MRPERSIGPTATFALTSREIVDGARPILPPIAVNDSPRSRPKRISTRSSNDNRHRDVRARLP